MHALLTNRYRQLTVKIPMKKAKVIQVTPVVPSNVLYSELFNRDTTPLPPHTHNTQNCTACRYQSSFSEPVSH
jgi:hypothetical protein